MRAEADSPTIGVSCGHRVPRLPVLGEPNRLGQRRKLYWCETCAAYRMSGGKTSGEHGHRYLFELRDLIENNPVPIVVDDPRTEHGRAVVRALGAHIR